MSFGSYYLRILPVSRAPVAQYATGSFKTRTPPITVWCVGCWKMFLHWSCFSNGITASLCHVIILFADPYMVETLFAILVKIHVGADVSRLRTCAILRQDKSVYLTTRHYSPLWSSTSCTTFLHGFLSPICSPHPPRFHYIQWRRINDTPVCLDEKTLAFKILLYV